jgi:hypothetical protein
VDRSFAPFAVSGVYAMDENGNTTAEHMRAFSRLLGVRDGTDREATNQEITEVSKHLYFYFVNEYNKGIRTGKWDKWSEEKSRPKNTFQSQSTRDDDGVFDGFDFNEFADQNLINGFEGVKAVEVLGASKTKVMTWKNHLCGGGLLNSIKDAISDHVDAQGAMNDKASKNKKANILNEITVFLQKKKMFWREGREGQHLFTSDKEQQKMRKYCGKKVGGEFYILMLKPDDDESA